MKICFIGHTFHKKTRSTVFLLDILRRLGNLTEFTSSPDDSPLADDDLLASLAHSKFDCYVFLQTEYLAKRLVNLQLGRFVIIPMYDGAVGQPDHFWQSFVDTQFISFSRAHHETLRALDCQSAHFRYFPPLPDQPPVREAVKERSAFFWERRPDQRLNLPLVLRMCRQLGVSHLHVHRAPDFSEHGSRRLAGIAAGGDIKITTSQWFDRHEDFVAVSSTPLFYFAPRAMEGIGMAGLEAMGRGQIVVAANFATMNEYLANRVSGLLYDLDDPKLPMDMTDEDLLAISRAASRKAFYAREEWLTDIPRLESILLADGKRWSSSDFSAAFVNDLRREAHTRAWA